MALGAVLAIIGLGGAVALALLAGGALAAVGAGGVLVSLKQGGAVRHRRVRTGAEGIIGHVGAVRSWTERPGSVARRRRAVARPPIARRHDEDTSAHELHAGDRSSSSSSTG